MKTKKTLAKVVSTFKNFQRGFDYASYYGFAIDNDWKYKTTTFEFKDGSKIMIDGYNRELRLVD